MKKWLGALGRTIVIFCITLALLAAAAALSRDADPSSRLDLLASFLSSLKAVFPFATAAALFLGFFVFEGALRSRLLSWGSLFLLGCLFLIGGAALREIGVTEAAQRRAQPTAGLAVEAGSLVSYARSYEGAEAIEAVGCDFQAKTPPRLSYAPRASAASGLLSVEGAQFPLRAGKLREQLEPLLFGPTQADIGARLSTLEALGRREAIWAALGFILLATGLSTLARLPRWPLAGFFLACACLYLLVVLDVALASPELAGPVRSFAGRLGLGSWPAPRVEAAIEAGLGLLAGLSGLLAPRRKED